MLTLYGNPISLLGNYKKGLLREFQYLHYFDNIKISKDEKGLTEKIVTIKEETKVNAEK